jgi:hypothetical protein
LRLPANLADIVRAGGLVGRLTGRTGTVPGDGSFLSGPTWLAQITNLKKKKLNQERSRF